MPYMPSHFPQVKYGVGPMVKGKVNGNLGFTVSYSMAKASKNKPAAWTVLSWLTGKVGMTDLDVEGSRAALAHGREARSAGGKAFLAAAPFVRGWALPQLLGHVHDHEQRPAGRDRRQRDDHRRCWPTSRRP